MTSDVDAPCSEASIFKGFLVHKYERMDVLVPMVSFVCMSVCLSVCVCACVPSRACVRERVLFTVYLFYSTKNSPKALQIEFEFPLQMALHPKSRT